MPMNYARTALLLAVLTAIFLLVGAAVGGKTGMIIAFVIALVMNILSLWKSDTLVLKLFKAKPVTEQQAPQLYDMTRRLAERADLPMPKLYIIENQQPNAFATGRSPAHSSVAVSTGLLKLLNNEETAGVIAHELAHIKNRDTLTMAVAATIGGATSMLAQYLQFGLLFGRRNDSSPLGWIGALATIILAPFAAMLVQMAISRSREYQADRMGGLLVGNPKWLASALVKISNAAKRIPNQTAENVPAAAHMFIVNPLTGQGVDNFFSTHPNVENRVRELEALSREMAGHAKVTAPLETGSVVVDQHGGPWARRRKRDVGRRGPWG
jgi:heat shock protein HtpX